MLLGLILIVLLGSSALWIARLDRLPPLAELGIGAPPEPNAAVAQGASWEPGALRADGFAPVAENDAVALYIDPDTGRIAALNKRSGYLWRSNPSAEELGAETAAGLLKENLQSPFVLDYILGTNTRRIQSNALDPKVEATFAGVENGVQVTYDYGELGLSFVIQYKITAEGFEAIVPEAGIREEGEAKLFSLQVLPYFGAVAGTKEGGYLFVPDGPGGLIRYDAARPTSVKGYEFPIYGNDPSLLKDDVRDPRREAIRFPVYGLVRGDQAYAAIVKDGKHHATVRALPAGVSSTFHSVGVGFTYREEYGRKVSGLSGETVKTVEEDRVKTDRRIEFRLLEGEAAGYVGMAHAYQRYLAETGALGSRLEPVEHVPMQLSIIGGGAKPRFGGVKYEAATTFREAENIVERLTDGGVSNLIVTVQGWQRSGRGDTDRRLPIAKELGGAEGAKRFADAMRAKGFPVWFEDYFGWKQPDHSDFSMKSDGVRAIDSTVLQGRFRFDESLAIVPGTGDFIVQPLKAIRAQKAIVDALKGIGASGIHYVDGPGNLLYSDYTPSSRLSRADTAFYYEELLDYTRESLGGVGVVRGNDYSLGHVDLIESLPFESNYDFVVDETVPFYPIAVHGYVQYSTVPGNLRNDYDADFLKAIEYGAVPYYRITHAPSRTLMDTDYEDVYSSEFAVWEDRILEEYAAFDRLSSIVHQRIADHERVAEGVYATTYEDGTRVVVDYNAGRFHAEEGGAE